MKFWKFATGAFLTVAAIVGSASVLEAGAGSNAVDPRCEDPEAVSPQAAVEVGSVAPDIALESIDGDSLLLSALRGEKNVILVFFRGTW